MDSTPLLGKLPPFIVPDLPTLQVGGCLLPPVLNVSVDNFFPYDALFVLRPVTVGFLLGTFHFGFRTCPF